MDVYGGLKYGPVSSSGACACCEDIDEYVFLDWKVKSQGKGDISISPKG